MSVTTHRLALAVVACAGLAGCSADKRDLEQFVSAERARQGGTIEPLPTPRVFDTFVYRPAERRSPFKVDLSGTALAKTGPGGATGTGGTGPQIDGTRAREYLEDYPLDALRMVGTIKMHETVYALVKDGEGTVHRVKSGNYVGQNHGKIVDITETEIRISEIVSDGKGNFVSRDTSLATNE